MDAIIFDFDGVIAESVDVKTKAFSELFKGYPDKVKAIESFHLKNGGMSRFDKFRHIYKNILKKELTKARFKHLCDSFHRLVIDGVIKAPYVHGAIDLLESFYERYPIYIVSGTPQAEIKHIIKKRKLNKYFKGVYGSPRKKSELLNIILKKNDFKKTRTFFIGDSKNDFDAARESKVLFAGRDIRGNKGWIKSRYVVARFRDLKDLKRYFKNNYD